jgi:hypothetical protein
VTLVYCLFVIIDRAANLAQGYPQILLFGALVHQVAQGQRHRRQDAHNSDGDDKLDERETTLPSS